MSADVVARLMDDLSLHQHAAVTPLKAPTDDVLHVTPCKARSTDRHHSSPTSVLHLQQTSSESDVSESEDASSSSQCPLTESAAGPRRVDTEEPLLQDNPDRFTMFPVR